MTMLAISIIVTFFLSASSNTNPSEVSALLDVYVGLHSPSQLIGWNFMGGDPCNERWRGITCINKSISILNIAGLGLSGILSANISKLYSLRELDISFNNISGEIPAGMPQKITYINLAMNKLCCRFPKAWPYPELMYLNISHNSISGPLGDVFNELESMVSLDLSFNNFSGDLPPSMRFLRNLKNLYLENNRLTGPIVVLTRIPLVTLNVENNLFTGLMPKQLFTIDDFRFTGNPLDPVDVIEPGIKNGSTNHPKLLDTGPSADVNYSGKVGRGEVASHHGATLVGVTISIVACVFALVVLLIAALVLHGRGTRDESIDVLPVFTEGSRDEMYSMSINIHSATLAKEEIVSRRNRKKCI